jgi:UDP-glucose 4-epimerase
MILLTGATGYIGSHTWVELLKKNYSVIGVDNLSNSSIEVLDQIKVITGLNPIFVEGDIRDEELLKQVFSRHPISHVIHLAALKSPLESMANPREYFDCNVEGLQTVLGVMNESGCTKLIFSSSAAVYGDDVISPISELTNPNPANYYGETKLLAEELIRSKKNGPFPIKSATLRYFNIAGNHQSGLLKTKPLNASHSLFSEIESVLTGDKNALEIFGADWDTPDGTCIRDYLHVSDLASAHLDVINTLDKLNNSFTINLGLGIGYSVKDVIRSYEEVADVILKTRIANRRVGDVAICYANIDKAKELINWLPQKSLNNMCLDSFNTCNVVRF